MQTWVTQIMEQLGYVGVFLMMALENLFPPIPSEVILPFAGFMTTTTPLTIPGVVMTSTTGSVLGAIILYGIGQLMDVNQLGKLIDRWGHVLRIKKEDIHKVDRWFEKYGYLTVLFCRMVPLVRSLISIPAGMSHMRFWLFLLFTIIGTTLWNITLILLGAALGDSWANILSFLDVYSTFVYISLGLGAVVLLIFYIKKKRQYPR